MCPPSLYWKVVNDAPMPPRSDSDQKSDTSVFSDSYNLNYTTASTQTPPDLDFDLEPLQPGTAWVSAKCLPVEQSGSSAGCKLLSRSFPLDSDLIPVRDPNHQWLPNVHVPWPACWCPFIPCPALLPQRLCQRYGTWWQVPGSLLPLTWWVSIFWAW